VDGVENETKRPVHPGSLRREIMRSEHSLGWLGVAMFVASTLVPAGETGASNLLAFAGIVLMLIAAWRASRWWLLPVALVGILTGFMFVLMHKRD
jgi:hypothetical protein